MLSAARRFFTARRAKPTVPEPAAAPEVVDDRNARYDVQTVQVMQRVLGPADSALDIGANEGSILASIVAQSPDGIHHAFEPIPALAAALTTRFPDVEVHQCALASERGESTFHHVVSNSGYSGLRERRYDREGERVEMITVPVERLDDVVPFSLPLRFVKIDVEGGELGVFTGGLELLSRHQPVIVFEHGLGAADYYGTKPESVHEILTLAGLSVTLMSRWLNGEADLSRDEFVDEFSTGRNYYFLAHRG